jgi:antitoxin component of RelBE/YafQ-DinJ toxin-antitoxin module
LCRKLLPNEYIPTHLANKCKEKRIPFDVSVDPFYSESNIKYLEHIVNDTKEGKAHFTEHDLIEVDE